MTCIVAVKDKNNQVVMGADSAGVGGLSIQNRVDPKIYRVGNALIGFTSSFRMGQLLGYSLVLPERKVSSIEQYMATDFIDAVRQCLKDGGYASKKEETERGGSFLVAIEGRIFHVQQDYQVAEKFEPYDAVGCGDDIALGSLYTTEGRGSAQARIKMALMAASHFSAGVRAPFITRKLYE